MKIYEIGTGYTPIPAQMGAATEIVVEELTLSLLKAGKEVEIIDIAAKERAKTSLPITEVKIPSVFSGKDVSLGIVHKLKRVVYSIALASKLKRILKNTDSKVVIHFHNQYNCFFFLKLTGKRLRKKALVAYTVHSHVWHGEWKSIKETVEKRYFQEVTCVKNADIVYVLNNRTLRVLTEHIGVPPSKLRLADNGVNTSVYVPLPENEIDLLKRSAGLEGKRLLVQVGSVCERKNQLGALEMLKELMSSQSDLVYGYAGGIIDSEYNESILRFAEDNGLSDRVRYFGELCPGKQLNELYNMAEGMIFPSRAEGFSLVIIEAMSSGIPVVVDRSLEFTLADNCLRFSDGDDFRRIVKEIVLDRSVRPELGRKCRRAVLDNYSWDKIASDTYVFE